LVQLRIAPQNPKTPLLILKLLHGTKSKTDAFSSRSDRFGT